MKRNMMTEWKRALSRTTRPQRMAWTQVFAEQRRGLVTPAAIAPSADDVATFLRSTRRLEASDTAVGRQDDLGRAILILQRNNKLLKARFGLEWPAATSVVLGESTRRNMSAASLARVLTAGLRRDARKGGRR
jgi:hypothetical protein